MIENQLIIDFNELHSNKIIKDMEFVFIVRNGILKKYKVIDTEQKLHNYYSNSDYTENSNGILVVIECNNILGDFKNAIFLEKFKIDGYYNSRLDSYIYLNFNNCEFFEDVELLGGDYRRIKLNNSIIRKNLFMRFINCEKLWANNFIVKENTVIENSEFGKFSANTSKFEENLLFQDVNITNNFILDKVKGKKELGFIDCRFEGLSKLELDIDGELNFSQCSFYKKAEINFDEISGKFSFYKTNFSDKCYLEYELLENKKYRPLIFEDNFKKTKWSFLIVSDIYKSSGRTEQYLETFYYFKKYERLERKHKNKGNFNLLEYLVEVTTKYYTSWERTLLTMCLIIMAFFLIYCFFPNLLVCKETQLSSKNLFLVMYEMYKEADWDVNFLISKFGNALYFTIITFTTVGYGDITPLNWMKLIVSLESFLGVLFTASFVVTLSRRFL